MRKQPNTLTTNKLSLEIHSETDATSLLQGFGAVRNHIFQQKSQDYSIITTTWNDDIFSLLRK